VAEKLTKDKKFKKPIKRVSMRGVAIQVTKEMNLKTRTLNTMEIELDGQKKPVTMNMFHSYCPFCGTKIEQNN
jgi:hypothetical protein